MISLLARAVLGATLAAATPAPAPTPVPSTAPGPAYDDPGMHVAAPAGWERVPTDPSAGVADAPTALFVSKRGTFDQRSLLVQVKPFEGDLSAFERSLESDFHSHGGAFVKDKTATTLANGMPAYFLRVLLDDPSGHSIQRDEYVVIDGQRGIEVAYVGRGYDDADARKALATLYVVAYPGRYR